MAELVYAYVSGVYGAILGGTDLLVPRSQSILRFEVFHYV